MQSYNEQFPIYRYDPDMPSKPIDWLVRGLWQRGKINGVAGFEKSGKSRLMTWLLVGLVKESVLNLSVGQSENKVLYLCGEETPETVNLRVKQYAELQGIGGRDFDFHFMEAAAMQLDHKAQRDWVLEKILGGGFNILVMDPLRRLHSANEDKSTEMAPILNGVRKWSNHHGVTIIMVHHTPKLREDADMSRMATWFRGSTDMAAILDTAMYVDRIGKERIEVRSQGRFEPVAPIVINDSGDKVGFERVR